MRHFAIDFATFFVARRSVLFIIAFAMLAF